LNTVFRMIVRYIASTDEPIRSAMISNMVPICHAWIRVMENLALPYPFIPPVFQALINQVARYDPLYEQNYQLKTWTVFLSPQQQSLTLPLLPPTHIDDFPLSILESLLIEETTATSFETIDAIIQTIANSLSQSFHAKVFIVRSALYYMLNFPDVSHEHREYFCDKSHSFWFDFFASTTRPRGELQNTDSLSLIDLFRICSPQYLSIEDRVNRVLPLVLAGSREPKLFEVPLRVSNVTHNLTAILITFGQLPLYALRRNIQLRTTNSTFNENESQNNEIFTSFISEMLPNKFARAVHLHDDRSIKKKQLGSEWPLLHMGQIVALLVLEGDPQGLLHSYLTNGTMPNLYMNSFHVRRGFCIVLDCNVFETVFADHEIPRMLELFRYNENRLRASISTYLTQ